MTFEDTENKIKAIIIFQHSRYDKFIGKLYYYNSDQKSPKKELTKLSEIKDIQKELCEINGSWLENLVIGCKEYWNIETNHPHRPVPIPNPLPSDPRYREDLVWLKKENENYA